MSSHVGYTGGTTVNPTYRQVCNGDTGHAEALQIEYDPSKVQYAELVEYHFRMHDPTQLNRQMNDVGTQYRSAIFFHTPEQEKIAIEVRDRLQATKIKGKIVTQIVPASKFYVAEDYHQLYLEANPYVFVHRPRSHTTGSSTDAQNARPRGLDCCTVAARDGSVAATAPIGPSCCCCARTATSAHLGGLTCCPGRFVWCLRSPNLQVALVSVRQT